jgi:hypothetical protein
MTFSPFAQILVGQAIGQAIVDHINTNNASIVAGSSREQRRPGRISTVLFVKTRVSFSRLFLQG